jgi:hypothetical protein
MMLQFTDRLLRIPFRDRFEDPVVDGQHQFDSGRIIPELFATHVDSEGLDGQIQ